MTLPKPTEAQYKHLFKRNKEIKRLFEELYDYCDLQDGREHGSDEWLQAKRDGENVASIIKSRLYDMGYAVENVDIFYIVYELC